MLSRQSLYECEIALLILTLIFQFCAPFRFHQCLHIGLFCQFPDNVRQSLLVPRRKVQVALQTVGCGEARDFQESISLGLVQAHLCHKTVKVPLTNSYGY